MFNESAAIIAYQASFLPRGAFTETVRMKLPARFEVDELPDALKLDTAFGSDKTSYEVKDGELVFTRTLAQRATTIPSATLPISAQFL